MTAMMLLSMASMLSQMDRVQAAGKRSKVKKVLESCYTVELLHIRSMRCSEGFPLMVPATRLFLT